MSTSLVISCEENRNTDGLMIKTIPDSSLPGKGKAGIIYLGNYRITLKDFLITVRYVLTNTYLKPKDPRLAFIKKVKSLEIMEIEGYKGFKRLGYPLKRTLKKKKK